MSTTHSSVGSKCKRCGENESVVYSRNDNFCHACFVRFIRGKQRKQMVDDRFKVKFQPTAKQTDVLLNFRLDEYASLVLFDILVELLKEQKSMGPRARVGFLLKVIIIDNSKLTKADDLVLELNNKYGEECLLYLDVSFQVIDPNTFSNDLNTVHLLEGYQTKITASNTQMGYWELLDQVKDLSTREDLANVIHNELLRRNSTKECVMIECDSMTTLAITILSLTIQGRGNEISNVLTDNEFMIHPLRDVLHSELRVYAQLESLDQFLPPSKREAVKPEMKSAKNKTVHELVSEYFQTIELDYPEVVSTVEKIGSKLNSQPGLNQICPVCNKSIQGDAKEWLEQITVKGHAPVENKEDLNNLQRYMVSIGNSNMKPVIENAEDTKLCYGCLVTLGASGVTQINWPKPQTDFEILDEYILTDSED